MRAAWPGGGILLGLGGGMLLATEGQAGAIELEYSALAGVGIPDPRDATIGSRMSNVHSTMNSLGDTEWHLGNSRLKKKLYVIFTLAIICGPF